MPKQKTHKGAAKRFGFTKTGLIKRSKAGKRHLLSGKSTKRKVSLRKAGYVDATNAAQIKRLLPYA